MSPRASRPAWVRELRPFDPFFVIVVVIVTVGVSLFAYSRGAPEAVSIQASGDEWIYGLDAATVVRVPGPIGETVVEIADGAARIVDSPCRDKICVARGVLLRAGEWAACLPNGVLVRIVGERADIDAFAY